MDPYAATIAYNLESRSADHASHESPGTKAEPEACLQEQHYYRRADRCHCRRGLVYGEYWLVPDSMLQVCASRRDSIVTCRIHSF